MDSISVSQISHNRVTVSWKEPKFANGVLQMYKLQIRSNRSLYDLPSWCSYDRRPPKQLKQVTLGVSVSSYEIQGLYPFEEYVITVAAASGVGYSEAVQLTVATAPAGKNFSVFLLFAFERWWSILQVSVKSTYSSILNVSSAQIKKTCIGIDSGLDL